MLTYQVKQGETISSIAQDFRISTAALLQANPSIQSVIYAGQHII
ncbi:LysM peptidoglycan-binding domain-containing protein, partial [Staphylococcus epidermidis]